MLKSWMNYQRKKMIKKRILVLLSLAIPFLLFTGLSFSEGKSQSRQYVFLDDIVLSGVENFFKVEILYVSYTSHRVFELSNPNRIVIDLHNIDNINTSRHFDVNEFGIKSIRAGMYKTDVARIVLDAEGKMPFYEIERIHGGLEIKVWIKEEPEEKIEEGDTLLVIGDHKSLEKFKKMQRTVNGQDED